MTDLDDALLEGDKYTVSRRDIAGQYPEGTAGPGVPGQSNTPLPEVAVGVCKDGGSNTQSTNDANKDGVFGAGDSYTDTYSNCKDGNFTLNGAGTIAYQTNAVNYRAPNDKAIESVKGSKSVDQSYANVLPTYTRAGSIKGQVGFDISDPSRVTSFKDYTVVVDGTTIVSNLVLKVERSLELGLNSPFKLTSMTGTLSFDGVTYKVTSTPDIAWKKIRDYLPTEGYITMTGPGGERLITQFTPNGGAGCGLIPAGTTTASIVVRNCSRF